MQTEEQKQGRPGNEASQVATFLAVKVSDNQWCEHQEGDHLECPLSKFSSGFAVAQ